MARGTSIRLFSLCRDHQDASDMQTSPEGTFMPRPSLHQEGPSKWGSLPNWSQHPSHVHFLRCAVVIVSLRLDPGIKHSERRRRLEIEMRSTLTVAMRITIGTGHD